ncbi:MAG: hypothetical protein AAF337_05935, partial [Pseudomonadota bacterium]
RKQISALGASERRFGLEAAGVQRNYTEFARDLGNERSSEERLVQLARQFERARTDFPRLISLVGRARSRGDVDMSVPALAFDYYGLVAADAYGAEAEAAGDHKAAQAMIAFAQQHQTPSPACPAQTPDLCVEISRAFKGPIEAIARTASADLSAEMEALEDGPESLETLASMTKLARTSVQRYGTLLAVPSLADWARRSDETRQALQEDLSGDILDAIESVNTSKGYREIKAKYFAGEDMDRPELEKVAAAFNAAMEQTTPFKDMPYARYFNALYNQEFSDLKQLDSQALAGVRPLLSLGGQQMALYGDLADALAGRKRGQSAERIRNAMRHLSVVHAVMGTYLIEYQDRYKACQSKGDSVYTITTRNDYVTRDGFGNEISRRPGWTNKESYRIPAKFRDQFDALFGEATQNSLGQLLDLFANDGNVARLRSGTRALMAKHACDSAEIQQFEWGLLAYSDDVTRRMEGKPAPKSP